MKRSMPYSLIGVLVLMCAAAVTLAASATAGEDQKQLEPGKAPGTFHLIYHGTVGFTMKPEFPTVVSISNEVTGMVARTTVTDGKPFTLEADLAPATYWINADPAGDPAKSDYQPAIGGQLHIDQHGNLSFPLGSIPLLHVHKMSGLSPANGDIADSDPPVLKWTKVEGAKFYRGDYQAGTEWKDFKTVALSFTLPHLKPGTGCDWEVWAQDDMDHTLASGFAWFDSHGTTPAVRKPKGGYLGIGLSSFVVAADPNGARRIDNHTTVVAAGDGIPCISVDSVTPGSPAEKADLRAGDSIIAVDGKAIASRGPQVPGFGDPQAFSDQIGAMPPGTVVTLTLRRDGKELKKQIAIGSVPGWLMGGVGKMSGLSPNDPEVAPSNPAVLKWAPVAGAKRYEGAFRSGGLAKVFKTDATSYTLPPLHPTDRCDWWVCAIDEKGRTLANGWAFFVPRGSNPTVRILPGGGYVGIVPNSYWITKDPNGTRRVGGGVLMSPGPTIPCIQVLEILPGSPALKADVDPGDWIIAVDGKPVAGEKYDGIEMGDSQAFAVQIRAMKPGTVVTFTIRRDSKELKIPVTVTPVPGPANNPTTQPNAAQ